MQYWKTLQFKNNNQVLYMCFSILVNIKISVFLYNNKRLLQLLLYYYMQIYAWITCNLLRLPKYFIPQCRALKLTSKVKKPDFII